MPNKRAAKKFMLQSQKCAVRNAVVRSRLRTLARKLREGLCGGAASAGSVAVEYVSELDKAVKKGVIHRNSANRRKSAVAKLALV
jgi:small subunit ribosomal protein S20